MLLGRRGTNRHDVALVNGRQPPCHERFRVAERFNIVPKPGVMQVTKLEELTAEPSTNGNYALIEFTGALPRAKLYAHWQVNTNDAAASGTSLLIMVIQ